MKSNQTAPVSVDEYIAGFPEDVQKILKKVRSTIRKAAPGAEEAIKYQIPTLILQGNLLSFAAFTKHLGLYPAPAGDDALKAQLQAYRSGKSSVRFPFDKPIPYDLISQIVTFRVKEHLARVATKGKKGTSPGEA